MRQATNEEKEMYLAHSFRKSKQHGASKSLSWQHNLMVNENSRNMDRSKKSLLKAGARERLSEATLWLL
jgi:hypothetical protein